MSTEQFKTTKEFLSEEVYLPGYMLLLGEDYDKKGATFSFNVKEPLVTRENIVHYLTPRGLHICISQGSIALVENMINEGLLEDYTIGQMRKITLEGRLKITELYQKFRREVELSKPIQGRFNVNRLRLGKLPVLKLDFDFANKSVHGNLVSVIAPYSMPQLNSGLIRF